MRDGFEQPERITSKSSPAKSQTYRIGGLSGFIPLNEDPVAISTRGQRLPSLLHSSSSTSIFTLPWRGAKRRNSLGEDDEERGSFEENRRPSPAELQRRESVLEALMTPQMRSMRLIGNSNPRYHWRQYYKSEEELKRMKKSLRGYYARNNFLIAQYMYIDRLLDSSLPHDLIQEYNQPAGGASNMHTISEEPLTPPVEGDAKANTSTIATEGGDGTVKRPKRTPRNLYKLPDEATPLLDDGERDCDYPEIKYNDDDDEAESGSPVVMVAIYINLTANVLLLIGKIVVIVLTSSLSVLASLVDAALDFLSTAIVWTTTKLISRQDQYAYPVGRRRLEPVGVLVFSVVMITSFFQVALQCFNRLLSDDRSVVELSTSAIVIMLSTVGIKGFCWFWCRLVKNSSVQALAQDAITDVVFNIFSIIFPLVGFYAKIWWLDALGGLLLSIFVIVQWSRTSSEHVRNLCGAAATADERNVLLYLTMRFAKTIRSIQGLQAYHAGDKLNVEVDIVLDEQTSLRDSHDLAESLQYVLESVPTVDRAFVHTDYLATNIPSHMNQQT
jgi:cation diffusion facilitator family transporter